MKTLIQTINSKLVEGNFDVNSEALCKIESDFTKAEDAVKLEFPRENSKPFDLFAIGKEDKEYNEWAAKIKYELEQKGFVKVKDGKNIVELHTPNNKVYYKYDQQQILIYSK